MNDITVTRNDEASRFEAHTGDTLLGYIDYTINGNVMDMPHTLVYPQFEGQGVGSKLVKQSLDMVREMDSDLRVTPSCPFIAVWIRRHADYQDLLAENDKQQ